MKQKSCNKLYSWLILIGISLQTFLPLTAAIQSQNIKPVIMPQKGTAGESIVIHSNEDQDVNENSQETISLHEFGVAEIVVRVVEDAVEEGLEEELSESLVKCYRSIIEEDGVVDVDTAIQAMPELLEYTVEAEKLLHRDRAVRPNAPSITDNNAIAGCGGDCDLTPLLRLLSSIRARIGSVKDSPCCGTILGILGDACNVPCIGEDGSISEVLCEILDCCTNISVDTNGVFTVLVDIKETITECCADLKATITDCCADLTLTITEGNADLKLTITECCADLKATITDCCTDLNTTITECCADLKLTITEGNADLKLTITECCADLKATITDCCTELKETITTGFACAPISLFQSDVIGDEITLLTDGQNYCLAENITGDIIISGANVTLDGNDRVLTGRIQISTEEVIIKNTKVKTPTPTVDPTNEAGIQILGASSTNVKITNCLVECEATSVSGVNGRTAISSQGAETLIEGCIAKGGAGGSGAITGFTGGNGIEIQGDNSTINKCNARGGNGGLGGTNGGNGGKGIETQGNNATIYKSHSVGGNGETGISIGGNGGNGIETQGNNNIINKCHISAGNGADSDTGGNGGIGIFINSETGAIIKECCLIDGGNGGAGIDTANGQGGDGILLDGVTKVQICGCKINNLGFEGDNFDLPNTFGGSGISVGLVSSDIQIINNEINAIGNDGIRVNGAAFQIRFCTIVGCSNTGISITVNADDGQIISNHVLDCGTNGIRNLSVGDLLFANNLSSFNGSPAYGSGGTTPPEEAITQNSAYWANVRP